MLILALDTSTPRATVALGLVEGGVLDAATGPEGRHGRGLVKAIGDLLKHAGKTVADLDAVAVGLGPGSFTGLRVGMAAAKGLAYAAGRPLIALDSLEAIARNAPRTALLTSVLLDAGREEFYAADFARATPGGPLELVQPARIVGREDWLAQRNPSGLVLGPGRLRLPGPLEPAGSAPDPADDAPRGPTLIAMARDDLQAGRTADAFALEPAYLRRSAAEEKAGPP